MKSSEDRIAALEKAVADLADKLALHIATTGVPASDEEAAMRHAHAEQRRKAAAEAP